MSELDPAILEFYRHRYDEDQRLIRAPHGRIEFVRTQELLRRHLPTPPATVLDIGGGTGVHARWLADDGYQVHLLDPVPAHVERAGRFGHFTARVADARNLPVDNTSADVTLLLGPLYHLTDAADRQRALAEAIRVTRPGGLVAVAAISRYAALLELAGLGRLDEAAVKEVTGLIATGINADDPLGFTVAYFHRPEELAKELSEAGLAGVSVVGIEGPSVPALENAPTENRLAVFDSALTCARLVESDPALMVASPHLFGVGRVGGVAGDDAANAS